MPLTPIRHVSGRGCILIGDIQEDLSKVDIFPKWRHGSGLRSHCFAGKLLLVSPAAQSHRTRGSLFYPFIRRWTPLSKRTFEVVGAETEGRRFGLSVTGGFHAPRMYPALPYPALANLA